MDPTHGISHSEWHATRAMDSDRNDTCRVLDTALSQGQLSMDEHGQRVSAAANAKTLGELQSLVSDLQTRQAAARATDSDRNDTCQELDTALSQGQLSMDEHRQRVSAATNAKTLGDLQSLVSDLQTPRVATQRRSAWSRPAVWLIVVVGVLAVAAAAGMVYAMTSVPSTSTRANPPTTTVTSTAPTAVPIGGRLTVSQDSSTSETIACNDGSLTLSGLGGTYVVTGHCVSLTVPGKDMNLTIDKADTNTVSGGSITVVDNVCNNGIVNLSDQSKDNVFHVHGHCAGLTVSGSRNNVTVENADTITVSAPTTRSPACRAHQKSPTRDATPSWSGRVDRREKSSTQPPPRGSASQEVLPFTGLLDPEGVAVDAAANLYVADYLD
jgi:Domain of unknown function (DUF1707)/Protein of unknown function (DUF3060)